MDPFGHIKNLTSIRVTTNIIDNKNGEKRIIISYIEWPNYKNVISKSTIYPDLISLFNGDEGVNIIGENDIRKFSEREIKCQQFSLLAFSGRHPPKKIYHKIILKPEKVIINGRLCYHLIYMSPPELGLTPYEAFFDTETFLLTRSIFAEITDKNDVIVTSDYLGYKNINGVFIGYKGISKVLGKELEFELDKIEFNPEFDKNEFKFPSVNK